MISDLLKTIGLTFCTLPLNVYIRHSSLLRFTITPKYLPILFNNIETYNPFSSFLFQFNLVNSMERNGGFYFIIGYIFMYNNKYLFSRHSWTKRICHIPHIFYHPFNSMIENYIILNELFQCHIFLVWLYEMANMYFHKIWSYIGSIFNLTNQLIIADMDNYHFFFLLNEIYIRKRRNLSLCYNFTSNKMSQSINI